MFNLGFSELILLGAIALIFIGPQQLPEVARTIGRLLNEWKRATSDLTSSFTDNDAFRDWDQRRKDYLTQVEGDVPPPVDPMIEHHHENPHPDENYPVELGPPDPSVQLELKIEDESDGGKQS